MMDRHEEDEKELTHIFTFVSRSLQHDRIGDNLEVQIHRCEDGRFFIGAEDFYPTKFLTLEDAIQKSEYIEVDGDTESVWSSELGADELAKLLRISTNEYSGNRTFGHKFTINDQMFKVEWRMGIVRVVK